jgi:2-isopropylmalate synthase
MTEPHVPKYANPAAIDLPNRQWPSRRVEKSPMWCSVDLRDGNQALPDPLTPEQKLTYFELLCQIGFHHIEVSFPSASQDDFDFTRRLIEEKHIPDDVFIMTLTQCRDHLIERTFESLRGIPRGIFHAYCATSDLHMRQVFNLTRAGVIDLVTASVKQIRAGLDSMSGSDIRFEFSPEEFTDSDPQFVVDLCEAVYDTWGKATSEKPLILNLPATVERRPPNQYADMIEWFLSKYTHPKETILSVHSHNDQGMAVAATELAMMAGAQRVEGTLFGHGERTGNVDLVIVANNLQARGIETGLDFSHLPHIAETVEKLTGMPIYYRSPYAGEYVFTAFSGSHQDAIRKGMNQREQAAQIFGVGWKVPYLHVDPTDVGRRYESLIRINSQSGKGGVVWVLEQEYGLQPPRTMHAEIGSAVQAFSDKVEREVTSSEVYQVFRESFLEPKGPYVLVGYWPRPDDKDPDLIHGEVRMLVNGNEQTKTADGNGPVSAFVNAIQQMGVGEFGLDDYHEQAVGKGADAQAVAYVPLRFAGGEIVHGVGTGTNIDQAAVRAIVAGLNRRDSDRKRG